MALYENIAEFYDEIFPLKQTRVDFIESFLKKHVKILDIGCASGELALTLSKKGHYIVGIDLDESMIGLAREKTKKCGLKIDFFVKDMTKLGKDFSSTFFDAVLCFGNTLVHLESLEKIREVFIDFHRVLTGGGLLMVQVVNYDRMLPQRINQLPLLENENFIFRREYDYNEPGPDIRFITYLTVRKSGQVIKSSEKLYPLTFKELEGALVHAGFSGMKFFGSETGMSFSKNSPALIAVAEK